MRVQVDAYGAEPIRLAYADVGGDTPEREAVLLLHGSPGRGDNFAGLTPLLAERYRVIVPDLPGFGASEARLPVYSAASHAAACLALLERLGIERAHWVGFSLGGAVAIRAADRAPERVASLTLLSSVGVQEFELLGDYDLNHMVHGAQWLLIAAPTALLPHFGWLDRFPLNTAYARNFYDTDQRPLRGMLERLSAPTLVLHSEGDALVPAAAAREHHRIVPQSRFSWIPGGHFALFRHPRSIAAELLVFFSDAEAGRTPDRAAAKAARVARAELPFRPDRAGPRGFLAVAIFVTLVFLATLVSEDLTCIGVGFLVARGQIPLPLGIAACAIGLFLGDLLLYATGRFGGKAARRWFGVGSTAWREQGLRRGSWAVLLSRFVPGSRLPLYVGAGVARFPAFRFAWLLALGAVVWTPVLVGASAWFGEMLLDHVDLFRNRLLVTLLLLVVTLLIATRIVPKLFHHRGRRLLRGKFERLRRWEFWPMWVIYPPVLLQIAGLAVKYRSLRVVTAANPGIEGGGLVGESKYQILHSLQRAEPGAVARTERFDWADATNQIARFRGADADTPIVIKPDEGERGFGVRIVRNENDLQSVLRSEPFDALLQEYVPGVEFGVFYIRFPSDAEGHIFSITEKRMLFVEGDGRRSLAELILDDDRAVCMAERHFERHRDRLGDIPASGERIQLTELGTHSRGAVFLDGSARQTESLALRIDRVGRALTGFHFGRFDVRSSSPEAFSDGEFKVIELNGITSEATHMYDPSYGLLFAYRVLFEQWRLAFALGAANVAAGARPASWAELSRLFRQRMARRPSTSSASAGTL